MGNILTVDTSKSSNIESAKYDANRQILVLKFRSTSSPYAYFGVPLNVWDAFTKAESFGKFFYKNIRDMYKYEKIV